MIWFSLSILVVFVPLAKSQLRRSHPNNKRLLVNEPCAHGQFSRPISPILVSSDETGDQILSWTVGEDVFGGSSGSTAGTGGGSNAESESESESRSESQVTSGKGGKGGKSGKGGRSGKGSKGGKSGKGSEGEKSEQRNRSRAIVHEGLEKQKRSRTVDNDGFKGKDRQNRLISPNVIAPGISSEAYLAANAILCEDQDPVFTEQSGVLLPPVLGAEQILRPGPSSFVPALSPSNTTPLPPGPSVFFPASTPSNVTPIPGGQGPSPTISNSQQSGGASVYPPSALIRPPAELPDTSRLGECSDAYVYCPGRTSCYIDETGSVPSWGLSVDLNLGEPLTILDDCEIWEGVRGCSLATGTKIGTATISQIMFHYSLDTSVYEANSFYLYAGKCKANDGGAHLAEGGTCDEEALALNADNLLSFPLIHQSETPTDTFTFDHSSMVSWLGYKPFPLGTSNSLHLVAQVTACPVGILGYNPLAGGEGRVSFPTISPTRFTENASNPSPTSSTTTNAPPTTTSTTVASLSPTDKSTGAIQPTPTFSPVQDPKFVDLAGQVLSPTAVPPLTAKSSPATCQDAWVYCPGRSKCLNDPEFNDGEMAAYGPDGTHNVWGWSIEFDPEKDVEIECSIVIGAIDCDINTALQVGTFSIRKDYSHFCFDDYSYAASIFAVYAGKCRGNDGGGSSAQGAECNPTDIALNAAKPQSFPVFEFDGETTINYTVDFWDPINTPLWPENHRVFPVSQNSYFSAYACVTERSNFVQPSALFDPGVAGQWQWGQENSLQWDRDEAN